MKWILSLIAFGTLTVGFLLTGASACHRSSALEEKSPKTEITSKDTVILEVENHNWADVVIYILVDGKRYRFLQVEGAKDVSKEIPVSLQGSMGRLRFAIHRIGSQDEYVTELVSLRTGKTIRLTIESDLQRTSIAVF